jgi:hypothetical protein
MLNIGSKYVELGLSETQEDALRNVLTKEVLIFAMVFTATRDIITSLLMTAAFFIISDFLFNEKSRFCVSSDLIYKFSKKNTTRNMNEPVTDKQVSHALDILQRAQHQHQQQ